MAFTILIDASELSPHIEKEYLALVDCRFSLDDTERGHRDYLNAHIPGAVYAHLDRNLSGKIVPGKTGRHPLPEVGSLAATLSAWGIDSTTQVVVYDDSTGGMAGRLWWLLNWMGHRNVAVLNGGWQAWNQLGLPVRSGEESRAPRHFEPHEISRAYVTAVQVEDFRRDPRYVILDARSGPRFRGRRAGPPPGDRRGPFPRRDGPRPWRRRASGRRNPPRGGPGRGRRFR